MQVRHGFYIAALLVARASVAMACDSTNPQVHSGNQIVWCADPTFWSAHADDVTPFFAFADNIVPQLAADFGFSSTETFTIVVDAPNGSASTPTPYGPGVNITGDAFYNVAYGVPGFYGYLLLIHEFINQWTGLANGSGGWPTDWWANHRSPFPNAMDAILLAELGQEQAALAQRARFLPGGDSADPEVPLFTGLFEDFGGWPMLRRFFGLIRSDGLVWSNLRDPPDFTEQTIFVSGNPSPLLADAVVAYFNLATGQNVQARFDAAGVGATPPNWTAPPAFIPYALHAARIAEAATAHCQLTALGPSSPNATAARAYYNRGDFAGALAAVGDSSTCGSRCTGECACDSGNARCAPAYLVSTSPPSAPTNANSAAAPNAAPMGSSEPLDHVGCGSCSQGDSSAVALATLVLMARRIVRRSRAAPRQGRGQSLP